MQQDSSGIWAEVTVFIFDECDRDVMKPSLNKSSRPIEGALIGSKTPHLSWSEINVNVKVTLHIPNSRTERKSQNQLYIIIKIPLSGGLAFLR